MCVLYFFQHWAVTTAEHQKGREQADLNTVRETELQATPSSFKSTSGREGALANNVPSLHDNKTHRNTTSYILLDTLLLHTNGPSHTNSVLYSYRAGSGELGASLTFTFTLSAEVLFARNKPTAVNKTRAITTKTKLLLFTGDEFFRRNH